MYARFQLYGMVLAALAMVNLAPSLGVPHIAPEFETLPDELKLSVMEQLPLADAVHLGQTSRSNYDIFQRYIFTPGMDVETVPT
ncbi:hypothetical protein H4R35_005880 [Dimargaris xerosporica]|nr:hypothetical protein H4R35_005880 [Dimargaris xerosporica]